MFEIIYKDIEEKPAWEKVIEKVLKQCFKEEKM